MKNLTREAKESIANPRDNEDAYARLARKSLEEYILYGRVLNIHNMDIPKEMIENQAGVFVIIKQYGQLRGCLGTTEPIRKNVAEEIVHNSIGTGTRDPRFFPVKKEELNSLKYIVDVMKEPEPIQSIDQLDVKRYGIIVSCDSRTGILLPNLEGIATPKEQVSIALKKAGIREVESYSIKRFEVIRHQ